MDDDGPVATTEDDVALLRAFATAGEREALDRLVRRHLPAMTALARALHGNAADADDTVQTAMMHVMTRAATWREDGGAVRGWMQRIVVNAFRQSRRAQGRRQRHEPRAEAARPVEPSPADERVDAALAALDELPPEYRQPVALRYLAGMEFAEVAAALGIPERTARTRVSRGLERIRASLRRRGRPEGAAALLMLLGPPATTGAGTGVAGGTAAPTTGAAPAAWPWTVAAVVVAAAGAAVVTALTLGLPVGGGSVSTPPAAAALEQAAAPSPALGSGGSVLTLRGAAAPAVTAALGPRGGSMVTNHADRALLAWDAAGAVTGSWTTEVGCAVAFFPDGQRILVGVNLHADILDAAGGAALASLAHDVPVTAVAVSPDGRVVATGGGDGTVRLWRAADGVPLGSSAGGEPWVRELVFAADGRTVAARHPRSFRFVDVGSAATLATWTGAPEDADPAGDRGNARCGAFTPDGRTFIACFDRGAPREVDPADGRSRRALRPLPGSPHLAWTLAGDRVAFALADTVVVRALGSDADLMRRDGPPVLAADPDGRVLVQAPGGAPSVLTLASAP